MSSDNETETDKNPLEDLYVDANAIDRERIRDALSGLIGIDQESGQPRFYTEFDEIDTKRKFTALLLYRRALEALDDLEDDESLGVGSSYFADLIDVDGSTIRHASNDLAFVSNEEEKGGYLVPAHNIKRAIAFLKDDES